MSEQQQSGQGSDQPKAGAWLEVQIETSPAAADLLATELAENFGGIELRDGETHVRAPAGRTVIITHTPPEDRAALLEVAQDVLEGARQAGLEVDPVVIRERETHEDEWRDVWKQFFRATRIGQRFVVRPSWDPGAPVEGDNVIDLDPGRAFGTGAHPSTRLVIAALESLRDDGFAVARFLDLGTGSGILSIAAARLWPAAQGLATDVDDESVACAGENFARNGVASVARIVGSLPVAGGPYDLVLANIQMDVLEELAPLMGAAVADGGRVILSGLLLDQAEPTAARYQQHGFRLLARRDEGEWASLLLGR